MGDVLHVPRTFLLASQPPQSTWGRGLEAAGAWMQILAAVSLTEPPGKRQGAQDPDPRLPAPQAAT